jgi:ribosomal protein L24E
MSGTKLNGPVLGSVATPTGKGYYMVASDGGIFAFDAPFRGSMGATKLNKPVVGMVRYGDGYLMVGADGGIFNFSSLPFSGSLGDKPPASPVVAVAALPSA